MYLQKSNNPFYTNTPTHLEGGPDDAQALQERVRGLGHPFQVSGASNL